MNKRGVTIIELLIVMTLIGVIAGFAFPRIGDAITKQNVRSARTLFIGTHAKARATAIQRGSQTQLILAGGRLVIQAANPVTNVVQQVGNVEDLGSRYGVTVQPTNVTLTFDARGIGMETTETTISITKGSYGNQIVFSPVGRVIQ
jgi:prepilin-type N-terminal cleavage/methylation domain-containing protein